MYSSPRSYAVGRLSCSVPRTLVKLPLERNLDVLRTSTHHLDTGNLMSAQFMKSDLCMNRYDPSTTVVRGLLNLADITLEVIS